MWGKSKTFVILGLWCILAAGILLKPGEAFVLAAQALQLWFDRMIPALFPFMILSGILIRLHLSEKLAALFAPVLRPFFRLDNHCLYVMLIGLFCGFPMGARACRESLDHKKITVSEGQLLLAFCNNAGPVYVTGYLFPLLKVIEKSKALLLFYGIPLLYGLILRYTAYRKTVSFSGNTNLHYNTKDTCPADALEKAINASIEGITVLGGYMIICNMLNLFPILIGFKGIIPSILGCLLEITGGLKGAKHMPIGWGLGLLTFGGLSCIAQTFSCIKGTSLSLKKYICHKIIQSLLIAGAAGLMGLS